MLFLYNYIEKGGKNTKGRIMTCCSEIQPDHHRKSDSAMKNTQKTPSAVNSPHFARTPPPPPSLIFEYTGAYKAKSVYLRGCAVICFAIISLQRHHKRGPIYITHDRSK